MRYWDRDTVETSTKVRAFLTEEATIIPGHGRPMRPVAVDFPVPYLRELDAAVSAAPAEGRSIKDTLEAVGLPQFGEYSLVDRAHRTVDVPAAYHAFQQTAP